MTRLVTYLLVFGIAAALHAQSPAKPDCTPDQLDFAKRLDDVRSSADERLDRIVEGARSHCTPLRQSSVRALGERGDVAAAPLIAALVSDPDLQTGAMACWALGELRDKSGAPAAVRGTESNRGVEVRQQCALALGRIADPAYAELLERLALSHTVETPVRVAAIRALTMMSQGSAIPALLTDADSTVRASAAYAACQLHLPEAVPAVRGMMSNPQERRSGLDAASVWPKQFERQFLDEASNGDAPVDDRLVSLSALSAVPDADIDLRPFIGGNQPAELQAAAVQFLSDQRKSSGRTQMTLRRLSAERSVPPEVRAKLNELGYRGPAPLAALIFVLGAGVCAGTLARVLWRQTRQQWCRRERSPEFLAAILSIGMALAFVVDFAARQLFLAGIGRVAHLGNEFDPGRLWPAFALALLTALSPLPNAFAAALLILLKRRDVEGRAG